MKKIAILGSTGSIGKSALKVVRNLKDDFKIVGLTANSNMDLLIEQIEEFQPEIVGVRDKAQVDQIKRRFNSLKITLGEEGLQEVAAYHSADQVIIAIVGMAALSPTIAAICHKKQIGIANKEVLVSAGELVTDLAKKHQVPLIPIDSEHSAIFQCLNGEKKNQIARIILTASGGPFRTYSEKQLANITPEEALKHPNWSMGPKVTIDSSTLMNKGLEVIEAYWLFEISLSQIEVVIHPESVIHSIVEFVDGSMIAQMSLPDMVLPIQYAMTFPERKKGLLQPFDFLKNNQLNFFTPNHQSFGCLQLAYLALEKGGTMPCFLNACNEILVERFLIKEIKWKEIFLKLNHLMENHFSQKIESLQHLIEIDQQARIKAKSA